MKHTRMHSTHMLVIAVVAVGAISLGYGAGWALAVALLGCGAMLLALFLLLRSDLTAGNTGDHHNMHDSRNS